MCDRRRVGSDPNEGEYMSSVAAKEAFDLLNAATKQEYRGWGDTQTAARDRAARKAGVSPAQAERVWKRWQSMKTVNGDVYRNLIKTYGHLCTWVEDMADRVAAKRQEIGDSHALIQSNRSADRRGGAADHRHGQTGG